MTRSIHYVAVVFLAMAITGCQHTKDHGAGGEKLGLTKPANQQLRQGDRNDVAIHINRDDFKGKVDIQFSNLPAGVTVANAGPIQPGDFLENYTFVVDANAPLAKQHPVTVTASALDMRVSQTFEVDVGK